MLNVEAVDPLTWDFRNEVDKIAHLFFFTASLFIFV